MTTLLTHPWAGFVFIIGIGALLAPILQQVWTLRFLIAMYIALGLVCIMPDTFSFNVYANVIIFFGIALIFTLIERGRFFNVNEWLAPRFSFQVFGLSILTVIFLAAVICFLSPLSVVQPLISSEVYHFLVKYIFYIPLAPLLLKILFSKRLG